MCHIYLIDSIAVFNAPLFLIQNIEAFERAIGTQPGEHNQLYARTIDETATCLMHRQGWQVCIMHSDIFYTEHRLHGQATEDGTRLLFDLTIRTCRDNMVESWYCLLNCHRAQLVKS